MSRYVPSVESKEASSLNDVSQEGFLGSVFTAIGAVIGSISRSMMIGMIRFEAHDRPEINGVACKNYQHFEVMLRAAIANEEPWDATIVTYNEKFDNKYDHTSNSTTHKSVAVFIGQGKTVKVRLPGYEPGDNSARAARFIIEDFKLKEVG